MMVIFPSSHKGRKPICFLTSDVGINELFTLVIFLLFVFNLLLFVWRALWPTHYRLKTWRAKYIMFLGRNEGKKRLLSIWCIPQSWKIKHFTRNHRHFTKFGPKIRSHDNHRKACGLGPWPDLQGSCKLVRGWTICLFSLLALCKLNLIWPPLSCV